MVPYAAAGPDLAIVTPSVMVLLVTPGSVAVVPLEPPQAASATRKAARAANRGPIRAIKAPPPMPVRVRSNSLRIRRQLSSTSFAGPPQTLPQRLVPGGYQPDHAVGSEDHDQDQESPVCDRRTGLHEGVGDLRRDPRLVRDGLAGDDRQPVDEDAAQQGTGRGCEASDHRPDQ